MWSDPCLCSVAPDLGPRLCPPGEVEVNGRCKGNLISSAKRITTVACSPSSLLCFWLSAAVPSLPSRPVIVPELNGHSVHLRCSFIPPPWSQPLGFQVVWARHIGHSMKAEIRQESTLKPFSLVEMDGVHFRLGEMVIPARLCWKLWGEPHVEGLNPLSGQKNVSRGSPLTPPCSRVQPHRAKKQREAKVCRIPLRDGKKKVGKLNQLQVSKVSLHMLPI